MVNILITGATGMIGRKLLGKLIREEYKISVLVKHEKYKELLKDFSCEFRIGNLLDRESLYAAIGGIDAVIHLAGITHTNSIKLYYQINTEGTKNLLEACEKNGVKKFIYISSRTASVEGGAYAHSKFLAEEEVKKSSIPWIILRLAEVYGAGEKEAIFRLIQIIKRNSFIPIIGNGIYRLSPVYIDDVLDVIVAAVSAESAIWKTYTIAGPKSYTYIELVDIISGILHIKKKKLFIPVFLMRVIAYLFFILKNDFIVQDQISRLLCEKPEDISLAKGDLNFHPKSFQDAIKNVL